MQGHSKAVLTGKQKLKEGPFIELPLSVAKINDDKKRSLLPISAQNLCFHS